MINSLACTNALSMWGAVTSQQLNCVFLQQTDTTETHETPLGIDFPPPEPDHFGMGASLSCH